MSKFSVKKPLTIFVAVIAVIILGIVAGTRMTPDLLPNINLPYAVVVTAYPGATPEEVELTVTKPVEQALATLDNISEITSTSNDSYSMVVLQFTDDADMDSVTVDIREKLSLVSGAWSDSVGTPSILKINPNMIPVAVAAVSYDGKSAAELTAFLNTTLQAKLEGTAGVASIDSTGGITESVCVNLSEEKVDALNQKLRQAIDTQFTQSKEQLQQALTQLQQTQSELEATAADLGAGAAQIQSGLGSLEGNIAQMENALNDKKTALSESKTQLAVQRTDLAQQQQQLTKTQQLLQQLIDSQTALEGQIAALQQQIDALQPLYEAASSEQKDAYLAQLTQLRTQLSALTAAKDQLAKSFSDMNTGYATAQQALAAVTAGAQQVSDGIAAIDGATAEMETGAQALNAALVDLSRQKADTAAGLYAKLSSALIGQNSLTTTAAGLKEKIDQLQTSLDTLEEQRTAAYDAADMKETLTVSMLTSLLSAQNFSMPVGYVDNAGESTLLRVGDKIADTDALQALPLFDSGVEGVGVITLQDVADVVTADNSGTSYAKINGDDGIILSFTKQSTYATAATSDNLRQRFAQLEQDYPGLHFSTLMDQGDYIYMIVESVFSNLIWGAVLAIIILFFFLWDIRPTFIIACSIPISVVFAIVLMYFSGVTLNMISLSGLAVGVGMLVDNSVVVIENIYRLRARGASAAKAAVYGASQVSGAIISSTLTTVCVFLPIVFVQGLTRQLFTDMALTITYSLMASLIVAMTLVPAMSSGMLNRVRTKKGRFFPGFLNGYEKVLRFGLRHKALFVSIPLVLLVASGILVVSRGFIFMPDMSSNQITASITYNEDDDFTARSALADEVSARIRTIEDVETVGIMFSDESSGGTMGMGSMLGGTSSQGATVYILLKDDAANGSMQVAEEIDALCADMDCTVSAAGSTSLTSYMSAMSGTGVSIKLYGDDLQALQQSAGEIGEILSTVEGAEEVDTGVGELTPEVHISVDKEKAAAKNLTVAQVYAAIYARLQQSAHATTLTKNDVALQVTVNDFDAADLTLADIEDMTLTATAKDGTTTQVRLQDVATLEQTTAMSSISRDNQRRTVTVTAQVAKGHNVSLVTRAAQQALASYSADGITLEFAGENESIMEAVNQLLLMLALAVALIYLIMVAQFQSLLSPFIVMFTIPLVFTGGFLALLLCGYELSVISLIGFILLSGIIVNNGIVLVDYINRLRMDGMDRREAIVEAGRTRMRPILMTAITTILGLLVMALGVGTGAELMQPIAVVCVGGLLYATLMTVFVVPVLYDLLCRKPMRKVDLDADSTITQEADDDSAALHTPTQP